MKKSLPKKKVAVKAAKPKNLSKRKLTRGSMGAGMAYATVGFLLLLTAGSMMLGNIVPSSKSPVNGQPVILSPELPKDAQNNLQLETFPGVTLTPTPTDTPTPTPTPPPPPPSHGSGGGGGGGSCFPKGTKITMADGSQKNIEEVKVGEKVMGWDGKKNISETVLELEHPVRDHLYVLSFADGSTLSLTREHPLYTQDGWKSISPESTSDENPNLKVGALKIGDSVLNVHGQYVKLASMKYVPGQVQTYNLKAVSGFDDYFAGGKLAHNKGSCFVAGTKILMADGSQKNIEDVKVGDRVMGWDGNKKVAQTVQATESPIRDHYYSVKLANGSELDLTSEHPVYTQKGWESISPTGTHEENPNLNVGLLRLGDKVLTSNGTYIAVTSMTFVPGTVQTYNLRQVSSFNNFFANGVLVHNKGGGGGGGGGGGSGGSGVGYIPSTNTNALLSYIK